MENLELYDKVRAVPDKAKKPITGGRMNGKTDINPMWRIKCLTENFGPAGIGWYYDIDEKWLEPGVNGEIAAFVKISLYIKVNDEWSKPIIGIGGNSFVAKERSGLYTSDECYKMALTDAISVACKALGVGADVYWDSDPTKYQAMQENAEKERKTAQKSAEPATQEPKEYKCCDCGTPFQAYTSQKTGTTYSPAQIYHMRISDNIDGKPRCKACTAKSGKGKVSGNA